MEEITEQKIKARKDDYLLQEDGRIIENNMRREAIIIIKECIMALTKGCYPRLGLEPEPEVAEHYKRKKPSQDYRVFFFFCLSNKTIT